MTLPTDPRYKLPPEGMKHIYHQYAEHDAWYSGSGEKLAYIYSGMVMPYGGRNPEFWYAPNQPVPYFQKAMFWAKELYEERRTMLHVPVAGDVATTSSNLLFAEPPRIRIPDAFEEAPTPESVKSQDRLDRIIQEGGVINKLAEAAETCAALGGVILKPVWDKELADYPILAVDQPDNAILEFKWGILVACTLFKVIQYDDQTQKFWRLLERHEKGTLEYGLYIGSDEELGQKMPLSYHPETADLEDIIHTQIEGILPRYIPNMKPNRKMRGSPLGQSDYAGSEGLMDSLDEVYTSWMRDIRLGQGRIVVPEHFLEKDHVTGKLKFDVDKEIFTSIEADPLTSQTLGISYNQFAIRAQEHEQTALNLIERIVSTAGYSPQSFGLNIAGRAESGFSLTIRERKSFMTKSKKESYWKSVVEDVIEMMLIIDKVHLGNQTAPFRPTVEFQDSIQSDIGQLATSVELINRAQAASIETKVRLLHPDWSEEQVKNESKLIQDQTAITVTMPNPDEGQA